ncbi:TetR/AcrR family transcriptional regulator [Agromyces atrinae]|nr:TetR/AcrR family transcriptional regulator [Agromyces atrinae]RXZ88360.1 TetR family transcriptional regulator [Agromyces atrinae]
MKQGRARTAAALESAAISLVLEHGYDNVTVDMIADAAGVSQRTFFNYFATKEAALLGSAVPHVDREAARAFVASTGPLLAEAVHLVSFDEAALADHERLFVDRVRAIASNPALLTRQMEKFTLLESELQEIVGERLATQFGESDAAEAALITSVLTAVIRHQGQCFASAYAEGDEPPSSDELAALITRVVPRLA